MAKLLAILCNEQQKMLTISKVNKVLANILDYEQSLIFLRDSRVGEHASARGNHLEETRRAAARKNEGIFARADSQSTIPEKNEGLLVVY